MTRVTSRSEPLLSIGSGSVKVLKYSHYSVQSGSLFAILKNTVRVRLRFDKNSLKPVYKTPFRVRFDSLVKSLLKKFYLTSFLGHRKVN